jgi:hypothetical protein
MKKLGFGFIWGLFMVLIFIGMAFLLVFTTYFAAMGLLARIILGSVFLVYAIFRGYQLFTKGR